MEPNERPGVASYAKEKVASVATEVREQTSRLAEETRARAQGAVREEQDAVAGRVEKVAGALLQAAHKLDEDGLRGLGRYASRAAGRLESVGRYLRENEPRDIADDAGAFIRRHPGAVMSAAFVAGVLAARFIKSTSRDLPEASPLYDQDFADRPVRS
jgi:hypothetical protein